MITQTWDALMDKPKGLRMGLWIGTLALIGFLFWQYLYSARQEEFSKLTEKLATTNNDIQSETMKVNKLPMLKQELKKINEVYELAEQKLPKEDEADTLLGSISYVARKAGIDAPRFTPDTSETIKDFYAEKLVNVEMRGTFHKVATFLDELSRIPRIVTVADISMANPKSFRESEGVEVDVKGVLKIFRYLRPEERVQNGKGTEDAKNQRAKRK